MELGEPRTLASLLYMDNCCIFFSLSCFAYMVSILELLMYCTYYYLGSSLYNYVYDNDEVNCLSDALCLF